MTVTAALPLAEKIRRLQGPDTRAGQQRLRRRQPASRFTRCSQGFIWHYLSETCLAIGWIMAGRARQR